MFGMYIFYINWDYYKIKRNKQTETRNCIRINDSVFLLVFFSVRLLSVLCGHSVFSSPPQRPMTSDVEGFFYHRLYPLNLFSYHNSWERASIFPFECSVLNKGPTGTTFITSLVWRGPWLGIEHGTSRTRRPHYTTWLSRRQW